MFDGIFISAKFKNFSVDAFVVLSCINSIIGFIGGFFTVSSCLGFIR